MKNLLMKLTRLSFFIENGTQKKGSLIGAVSHMKLQNEALTNEGQTPVFSQSRIDNTKAKTNPYYYPDVDWLDALMKKAYVSQRVNLNVSGDIERVQYFIAGLFLNQNGMYKSFDLYNYDNNINVKRYNFRSNVDVKLTKTTLMSVQLSSILQDEYQPTGRSIQA